ncbi:MAG: hypothetical protein AAGK37_18790 [Pseudomonadota bacterium]
MTRFWPRSLIFFAIAAGVYVLQIVPFIGIFLMFLVAFAWPAVLVNGGMIGIAVEATRRSVSRFWLIVPAFFCLGFLPVLG